MASSLFTNYAGYPTTRFSYSMGTDFKTCKKLFQLKRLVGFKERDRRAAMEIGNVIEEALKLYHEGGCKPGTGVDEFKRLWLPFKTAELTYGAKDGDWSDMYRTGSEMLALYEVKWRSFGYANPKFQRSYVKEVFPGSDLAGIEFVAYVDMLVDMEYADGKGHPGIVDIKVSGAGLDTTENLLRLDPQLRSYAWVSGIPDVAFLWMERHKPGGYKKGDKVTMLAPLDMNDTRGTPIEAGVPMVVHSNTALGVIVLFPADYDRLEKESENLKGNALAAVKDKWAAAGFLAQEHEITKQRISFTMVNIPPEDREEQGEAIGQQIAEIAAANRRQAWPKEPGIRWPNDRCKSCVMLGVCLKNDKLIDEKLIRPRQPVKNTRILSKDWLDDIG